MHRDGTTLDAFINELITEMKDVFRNKYDTEVQADTKTVLKTNVEAISVSFKFPVSNAAPSIYPADMYEQYIEGESLKSLAERSCRMVYDAHKNQPDILDITIEEARKHITLNLINTEKNEKLLSTVPHMEIGDLSAVPRWYISDEASFLVSNDMAATLMCTPEEILSIGQHNVERSDYEAKSMKEVLLEQMGLPADEVSDIGPEMIVLTVPSHVNGARALLSDRALTDVHDRIGDFVVLPSSIHEVICIPADSEKFSADGLRDMVNSVNDSCVDAQDYLSNNIMKYDGRKLSLVGASLTESPAIDSPSVDDSMSFGMGGM